MFTNGKPFGDNLGEILVETNYKKISAFTQLSTIMNRSSCFQSFLLFRAVSSFGGYFRCYSCYRNKKSYRLGSLSLVKFTVQTRPSSSVSTYSFSIRYELSIFWSLGERYNSLQVYSLTPNKFFSALVSHHPEKWFWTLDAVQNLLSIQVIVKPVPLGLPHNP